MTSSSSRGLRRPVHALLAMILMASALFALAAAPAGAAAVEPLAGCNDNVLPSGEDASVDAPIGFDVNFYGNTHSELSVNENGNVTFVEPFDFYPGFDAPLSNWNYEIIAPLFANGTREEGGVVTYGQTTYAGRPAFCVNWTAMTPAFFFFGQFGEAEQPLNHAGEPHNTFQLILVERSDVAPGDFDVIFNYDEVQWDGSEGEEGEALAGVERPLNIFGPNEVPGRAGYSDGNPFTTTSFELPGSGELDAFLDTNPITGLINNSLNSLTLGRYLFNMHGGSAPAGSSIEGTVTAAGDGSPVVGAPVTVCLPTGSPCSVTTTGPIGNYQVGGLPDGDYSVSAFAPPLSSLLPATVSPVTVAGGDEIVDFALVGPTPPPPGTTIEPSRGGGAVPVIYWNDVVTVTTTGCPGGVATLQVIQGATVFASEPMVEGPAGTYTGSFGPLFPSHDEATVVVTIDCPEPDPDEVVGFDIYIDPSGTVFDEVTGDPVDGATTTLYRSDSAIGPFAVVPDGSAIMSPSNRTNPDVTGPDGLFGWDVIAGFYFVRAEAPGCVDPADSGIGFVDTPILQVEPEWLGLEMFLSCSPELDLPADITVPATSAAGAIVGFTADAFDAEEGPLAVTCGPASGALFPVGLTTVVCEATDSFGYSSAGAFDVTVEPFVIGAIRPGIQDVRDLLDSLGADDKSIDKAIEQLDKALDDDLWLTDDELTDDGKDAFKALRKAVKKLDKVKAPLDGLAADQAEILADYARDLALGAIAAAAGGDEKDIAKALSEMAKAEEDRAAGKPDKAINHYRKAWEKARKALD